MRQLVTYFPHTRVLGKRTPSVFIPHETVKPRRLWTLYENTDQTVVPSLPITPIHWRGAFLEDYVHDYDWTVVDGGANLNYYSRVVEGCVWLLLEFDQ